MGVPFIHIQHLLLLVFLIIAILTDVIPSLKFTSKYFIISDAIMNRIVSFITFSDILLLMHSETQLISVYWISVIQLHSIMYLI